MSLVVTPRESLDACLRQPSGDAVSSAEAELTSRRGLFPGREQAPRASGTAILVKAFSARMDAPLEATKLF